MTARRTVRMSLARDLSVSQLRRAAVLGLGCLLAAFACDDGRPYPNPAVPEPSTEAATARPDGSNAQAATTVALGGADAVQRSVDPGTVGGAAAGTTGDSAQLAIHHQPMGPFFPGDELEIREGETKDIEIRYQGYDLRLPWDLDLWFLPLTASLTDFRIGGRSVRHLEDPDAPLLRARVRIPAGQSGTGAVVVSLTAVSDLSFDEGEESLAIVFAPTPGQAAGDRQAGLMTVTISEEGSRPCAGIVFEAAPPEEFSEGIRTTTVTVRVPEDFSDVVLDWSGPYYSDWYGAHPYLEAAVMDWQVESAPAGTQHSFEIAWPGFQEVGLRPYAAGSPCDTSFVCDADRCETRP